MLASENLEHTSFQQSPGLSVDVGFCFYEQSLDTVQRAIESIRYEVNHIFAIDGKFEFFKSKSELSSDVVRRYLSSIDNVVLVDYPNRKENEKRQQYLDLCKKYLSDCLIILDADEWVTEETDWPKFRDQIRFFLKKYHTPKIFGAHFQFPNMDTYHPRVWVRPYLIDYMQTHNFFKFETDGTIWKSTSDFPKIADFYMRSNDKLRSKNYVESCFEYQKRLIKYEKPFKEMYRKIAEN